MIAARQNSQNADFPREFSKDTAPAPTPNDAAAAKIKALLEEGDLNVLMKLAEFGNQYGFPNLAEEAKKRLDQEIETGIKSGKIELDSPIIKEISNNPELAEALVKLVDAKIQAEAQTEEFIKSIEVQEDAELAQEEAAIKKEYDDTPELPHYGAPSDTANDSMGFSSNTPTFDDAKDPFAPEPSSDHSDAQMSHDAVTPEAPTPPTFNNDALAAAPTPELSTAPAAAPQESQPASAPSSPELSSQTPAASVDTTPTPSPTLQAAKSSLDDEDPKAFSAPTPTAPMASNPSASSAPQFSEDPINIGSPEVGKSMTLFSQAMGGSAPGPDITPDPV